MDSMDKSDKHIALNKYHQWLKKIRKDERRLNNCEKQKIYHFYTKRFALLTATTINVGDIIIEYRVKQSKNGEVKEYLNSYYRKMGDER